MARERLTLLPGGRVRYAFKRRWSDGSTGVEMAVVDFVGKLAALIPRPRQNMVRYHGCLAPRSKIRGWVVRDRRTLEPPTRDARPALERLFAETERAAGPLRARNYRWAELMRRVFEVDVLECECGGKMTPVAEITDRKVVRKILEHLGLPADEVALTPARGPPDWDEVEAEPPWSDNEWL